MNESGPNPTKGKPLPLWEIIFLCIYEFVIFAILIIWPSGNWAWLEGWIYTVSLGILTSIFILILNKKNPDSLRNRLKNKKTGVTEKIKKDTSTDRWILPLIYLTFIFVFITPSLNERYGWTSFPSTFNIPLKIIGFILVDIGICIAGTAMLQNTFASSILDINEGHKLIDTGLYAHVRHPLYLGGLLWLLGTPLALGYLIALIPAIILIGLLVLRIKYEEDMLVKEIAGYEEYRARIKYKLIPKIF